MNEPRHRDRGLDRASVAPLEPCSTEVAPLKPDPRAHAEILVLTYGLQTAAWIAETNTATARHSDTPYWVRVLEGVQRLRRSQHPF